MFLTFEDYPTKWLKTENDSRRNNSKNIESYFDISVDEGDIILDDIQEIDSEFEVSDASSDEFSQIDYEEEDLSDSSGDDQKSGDLLRSPTANKKQPYFPVFSYRRLIADRKFSLFHDFLILFGNQHFQN